MPRLSRLRISVSLFIVVFALLLTGCAKSIVGTWKEENVAPSGTLTVTTRFRRNGTFGQTATLDGRTFNARGTYKADNGTLTMQTSDISTEGVSILSMLPSMLPPGFAAQLTRSGKFRIVGDKLEIEGIGRTRTLTRIKD